MPAINVHWEGDSFRRETVHRGRTAYRRLFLSFCGYWILLFEAVFGIVELRVVQVSSESRIHGFDPSSSRRVGSHMRLTGDTPSLRRKQTPPISFV